MQDLPKNDDKPATESVTNMHKSVWRLSREIRKVSVYALLAVGTIATLVIKWFYESQLTSNDLSNIAALTAVAIGFVGAAFSYLSPNGRSSQREQAELEAKILKRRMVQKSLETFDEVIAAQMFSEEAKERLFKRLEESMTGEALMSYHATIKEDTAKRARESHIPRHFSAMYERLSEETAAQARRGNVNLILGIFMTTVGLGILAYSVYYAPSGKLEDLLAYFAPRLSLGILVQVFSYFFLRLYKQSLSEIKYFQNEITNIESQQLAILMAKTSDDGTLPSYIVQTLMKTERNFLMNKDQTTIELERERIEQSKVSELIQAVKEYAKPKN